MGTGASRRRILMTSLCLAICSSICLAREPLPSATAKASTDLRKHAPDAHVQPNRARLHSLITTRYPHLLTKRAEGTPTVTMLFDSEGRTLYTHLGFSPKPLGEPVASEPTFSPNGADASDLQYIGAATIHLPANTVLVLFAGTGSRDVDRALVRRFFPSVLRQKAPLKEGLWILFDHDGTVLRHGRERFKPEHLRRILEKRYAGIRTSDMTATPIVGQGERPIRDPFGQPAQLSCVWLARGSPLPQ
jgi:hypothetical protein